MSEENSGKPKFSRRDFLKLGLASAGGVAIEEVVRRSSLIDNLEIAGRYIYDRFNKTRSKETLERTPFEVGFTSHAMDLGIKREAPGLDVFKKHVDILVASNQEWIRFDIRPWQIVNGGTPDSIQWHEEHLREYDEAIRYAREKGLKLFINISTPDFAQKYSSVDYKKVMKKYAEYLADRFKPTEEQTKKMGKAFDIWQIFNEPDIHDFRDYSLIFEKYRDYPSSYLHELALIVKEMDMAIKSNNPHAKTTLNLAHWQGFRWDNGPEGFMRRATRFCDAVAEPVDIISIDPYPDNNKREIESLPQYVSYFKEKYRKDIIFAEIGATTNTFSQEDQAILIKKYLSAIRSGKHMPLAVLIYQLTDDNDNDGMGLINIDGKPKKSFTDVIENTISTKK